MVSVTQRVTQYNKEVGQPRGGFLNPRQLAVVQLHDDLDVLDQKQENVHPSVVGMAVDYLSRLALVRLGDSESGMEQAAGIFRASLLGAGRITETGVYEPAKSDAVGMLGALRVVTDETDGTARFLIDDEAVRIACRLSTYDVGVRSSSAFYNPESTLRAPNAATTEHVLAMVRRSGVFFEAYGPVTKQGFVFVSEEESVAGRHGGYTELVDSGDGDFLTADSLWDFKVSVSKPNKDHTLQLLMYFLMGKQSGLPEFETQTHVGFFNPRLNVVSRQVVSELPAGVIDVVRREVIGYPA